MSNDSYCPHCGEPIDEDAAACPHCGSDAETGWKSDIDYYSVELPEDDELYEEGRWRPFPRGDEHDGPSARGPIAGVLLATAALTTFMIVGFHAYRWGVLIPSLFLVLCFAITAKRKRRPRRT